VAELRLLSYNVRSLRDDVDSVAAGIRACRPDVVAVQEAPRFLRWRSKRAALARKSGLVVATADRPGGLLLMTTLAVQVEATHFALLPKAPKLHQRAVCSADLAFGGAHWTVASVHFSLSREERARHLSHVFATLGVDEASGERSGPALAVAGDINERPAGESWKRLAATWQDAYAVAPDGPGETYRSDKPYKRIDGVFVDRRVEVVSCAAVHDVPGVTDGSGPATLVAATDPLPVLAVLRQ
jgi:endonuclease/exonuclease/phosphatase family metal-dependent hydrolase